MSDKSPAPESPAPESPNEGPSLLDRVKELKDSVQSSEHAADQKAAMPEAGPDPGRDAGEIPAPTPADSPDPRPGPTGPAAGTSPAELLPQAAGPLAEGTVEADLALPESAAVELNAGTGGAPAGRRQSLVEIAQQERDRFADTLRNELDEARLRIRDLEAERDILRSSIADALRADQDVRAEDFLSTFVDTQVAVSGGSRYAGAHEYDDADEVDDDTRKTLDRQREAARKAAKERAKEREEEEDNKTVQTRQAEGNARISGRGEDRPAPPATTPPTDRKES